MKITTKHFVIGGGLLLAGFLLLGKKVKDWKAIMPYIKAIPTDFRNLKINWEKITFDVELTLLNNSNENFNPDGIVAQLDRVKFMAFGQTIATLNIKQTSLNLPAKGTQVLKGLKCEVPLEMLPVITKIRSFNDISAVAVMNVLGQEYEI